VPFVECVPNFSEGRDPDTINAIRDAIANTPGISIHGARRTCRPIIMTSMRPAASW